MNAIQQTLFKKKAGGQRKTIDAPKGKKQCSKCRKVKLIVAFSKSKSSYDGFFPQCKQCVSDAAKANRAKSKARSWLKNYGLTEAEYWEMFNRQGGVCAICHQPETRKHGDLIIHLSVDHDHQTGKIRELLCYKCNCGLSHFRENIALMEKAIAYLRRHSTDDYI